MDLIRIRGLRVQGRVGWSEEERAAPQWLVIDVDVQTDLAAAGRSDDLADTVDYGRAAVAVAELIRAGEARLLEHLAQRIVDLLAGFEHVRAISVEISKESPPIEENVGVAVRIERSL